MATELRHPNQPDSPKGPYPKHVAIIMDGSGRWANERGLPRLGGHQAGTENIRRVIRKFHDRGVKWLTIYAFSTENWSRPTPEITGLWRLLESVIRKELAELHSNGIRILHIGRRDRLATKLLKSIDNAIHLTKENTGLTLSVALDYGGRAEIVDAVQRIVKDGKQADDIDEETISSYLHTAGVPDPDLVIRTAGEMRLSNFLTWQSVYAEYYFTTTYWPDFDEQEIEKALDSYSQRERRFGGIEEHQ